MLGAIAGDIIGSPYESGWLKITVFPLFSDKSTFTDDTVLTVATADVLLQGGGYAEAYHRYFHMYPNAGFGDSFCRWAMAGGGQPYRSYGNGSAMRVCPVGWAFDTLPEVMAEAQRCAEVTHNHPEGIKGAQATACSVLLARRGVDKREILEVIEEEFGYDLDQRLDSIRPRYRFDVTCQGTVPVAIRAFLESEDWEHAVRLAVSMGGDSDTLACITGGIAEAFYGGVPDVVTEKVRNLLTLCAPSLLEIADEFAETYAR